VIAFIEKHPSLLASILQAAAPVVAGKQDRRRDPAPRLTVDAVKMRTFGDEQV